MLGLKKQILHFNEYLRNARFEYHFINQSLPNVKTIDSTIEAISTNQMSLSRFGDGEFKLMCGVSHDFQIYEEILVERLKHIVKADMPGLAVAIPNYFGSIPTQNDNLKFHIRNFLRQYRAYIYHMLDFEKIYYDTLMTQYYNLVPNSHDIGRYFKSLMRIWEGQDIFYVRGRDSHRDSSVSIFDNARSRCEFLAPSRNAFTHYADLLDQISNDCGGRLVLISLGPTATILAHDLHMNGIRALDIGHLDKSYSWFCKGKIVGSGEPFVDRFHT